MKNVTKRAFYSFVAKLLIVTLLVPMLFYAKGATLVSLAGPSASGNTASGNTASGNTASGNTASGNTASGNYYVYPDQYFYDQQFRWQQMVEDNGDYTPGSNQLVDGYYGGAGAPHMPESFYEESTIYIYNNYFGENEDLLYIVWDNASTTNKVYNIIAFDNGLFGYTSIEDVDCPNDSRFTGKPDGTNAVYQSADLGYMVYLQFTSNVNGRAYAYYKASRNGIPVSGINIKFYDGNTTIDYGATEVAYAEIEPYNATNQELIWESRNSKILEVMEYDEYGCVIKAVGTGETDIRAEATDGSGVMGMVHVKVNAPSSPTPKLGKTDNSILVSWDAVAGVSKYRLYRKTGDGNWNSGTVVTGTSYEDTNVTEGEEYTYLLRCVSDDGKSLISTFDSKKSAKILFADPVSPVPTLTKTNDGVNVSWDAQVGVSKYRVYRKTAAGSWDKGVVVTGTEYLDTDVVLGNEYSYVIRCVSSDGKTLISSFDGSKARSILYANPLSPVPQLSRSVAAFGIAVNWDPELGVSKYRVYRKTGNGSWNSGVIVNGTGYTDTNVELGNEYTYLIRCVSSDGKSLISSFDSSRARSILFADITSPVPQLTKLDNGIKVEWEAQPGVTKYRVYRRIIGGTTGWDKGVVVNGTEYTDTNVTLGNEYQYLLRCVSADGKSLISDFDSSKARTILYADPESPKPTLTQSGNNVFVDWEAQPGVNRYRLYRKSATTDWVTVTITSKVYHEDVSTQYGETYTYLVRCVSSDGKSLISPFDMKKSTTITIGCNHDSYHYIPGLKKGSTNTFDSVKKVCDDCGEVLSTRSYHEFKAYQVTMQDGTKQTVYGYLDHDLAESVWEATNEYRIAQGSNALGYSTACQAASDVRAIEIAASFEHTRPDGTRWITVCSEWMSDGAKGENIASGSSNVSVVMNCWKASEGHNKNMLDNYYGAMSVGVFHQIIITTSPSTKTLWVQNFTKSEYDSLQD